MIRPKSLVAFTLVELLVVIGIIALLISILLPALNKARQAANTIACAANLRSITQAMHIYASQWKGWIPGGSNTTGRFLFNSALNNSNAAFNNDNCPTIVQNWDWMSPIAQAMGIRFNLAATQLDRVGVNGASIQADNRFDKLRLLGVFQCPENQYLASPGTFTPAPVVERPPAYAIAIYHHLLPYDASISTGNMRTAASTSPRVRGFSFATPPSGYAPQLTKIKKSSEKIFIADGGRFSNITTAVNVTLPYISGGGGAFGDAGPWTSFSNSWNRSMAPGNGGVGTIDSRIFAYRHGKRIPFGPADSFRMNCAFFDGHVELLGDLESSNPAYWMPSGTSYDPNNTTDTPMVADAKARFGYTGVTIIP